MAAALPIHGKFLETVGDITQFALPVGAGLVALAHPEYRKAALSLGVAAGIQKIALLFLKKAFPRPRPTGTALDSFPSGHTAGAFLAVGFSASILGKEHPATLLLFTLATVTGVSRHIAKKHWPSDIAFGAVMGIVFSVSAVYLVRNNLSS